MGLFKTLLGWATSAWGAIAGIPADIGKAITNVWHYVTSVHNLLSWLTANPLIGYIRTALTYMTGVWVAVKAIHDVLARLGGWIWVTEVRPVRDHLQHLIAVLAAWTAARIKAVIALAYLLAAQQAAYTRRLVGMERLWRIQADRREAAARIKGDKAVLATVQRQAADGYNSELHTRLGVLGTVLDQLGTRNPLVKGIVKDLITGVIDLETIDNPVLRFLLARLLTEVVDKAGVDKVMGEFAQSLLGPLLGAPKAHGLFDVARDASARLTALESQWAAFMAAGGPEVEQAGREWKRLTDVGVDVTLLGVVGLGVADPAAWAAGVADTIGVAGNDALIGIIDLIRKA